MNMDLSQTEDFITRLKAQLTKEPKCDIIIAPPYVNLYPAFNATKDSDIIVAAQNMHQSDKGAFTGEISAKMLESVGVRHVILGHSERRAFFNENDDLLTEKVNTALEHGMTVIFCFGEDLDDRKAGKQDAIVENQIKNALFHLTKDSWKNIILAYEPVWAIGTGETASPQQAQEMHEMIRNLVKNEYGDEVANNLSILYGGSVKPANSKEIFSQPDVDGGLIGGASLDAVSFSQLIYSFQMSDYIEYDFTITPTQPGAEILVAQLGAVGFESFVEKDDGVTAYITTDADHKNILDEIQILNSMEFEHTLSRKHISQINWNEEWEKNFHPITVDDRCTVRAPFHEATTAEYEIIIEPKMSFGTGHHQTTHMMIQHLINLDCAGKSCLDMGCGTGVLAILAAMRGANPVDAIDIDEWCYENSIENKDRNSQPQIKVYKGGAEAIENNYDIFIANINRNILLQDMSVYAKHINPDGVLLLSGFYTEDLDQIKESCQSNGLTYDSHIERDNWVAAKFIKDN